MSQTVKFSIEKLSAVCVLSPNNPERKKQFLHLKKNLPQLKAFPAIMGNALSKKDIQSLLAKKILDKRSISFSLIGEIGVYLSHLQILEDFVVSKQKYCLIFEDDIHLEKNFKNDLREALQECPEDWDLLYLYAKPEQKKLSTTIKGKKYILKAPRLWYACAYVVSPKGAKKIIDNIQPMRANPIDEHFGELVTQNKLQAFIAKKKITNNIGDLYLGNTNQLTSTIQNSNYFPVFFLWQIVFRFLHFFYFFLFCIPSRIIFCCWPSLSSYGIRRFSLWKIKVFINSFKKNKTSKI